MYRNFIQFDFNIILTPENRNVAFVKLEETILNWREVPVMAWSLYRCSRRCLKALLWSFRRWVVLFSYLGLVPHKQQERIATENDERPILNIEGTVILKLK